MVAFGKLVGIDHLHVAGGKGGLFKKRSDGLAGLIAHRPGSSLHLSGFAPGVAGAADLHRHSHGKLGRVDDGLAFLEDRGLG